MKPVEFPVPISDLPKRIIAKLSQIADQELLTYQIYSQLRESNLVELFPDLNGLLHIASSEDKHHYHSVINHLGSLMKKGKKIAQAQQRVNIDQGQTPYEQLRQLLQTLRLTEESSIRAYTEICTLTIEHDYKTFDLSYRNLHENLQHQHFVTHFLNTETVADSSGFTQGVFTR